MTRLSDKPSPIEVRLSRPNIGVSCHVVFEDESDEEVDIQGLSIYAAEREITAHLIRKGYTPVARWETLEEDNDGNDIEVVRNFRMKP